MSEFKTLSARECAKRLSEIENPVIFIHVHPDADALGSATALVEIFRQLGTCAEIMCQDDIPERLKFLLDFTGATVTKNRDGRVAVSIDVASPSQLGTLYDESSLPVIMIDHHNVGIPFADNHIVPDLSSAGEVLYTVACELRDMGKIEINKTIAYALYSSISSDTGRFSYTTATPTTYRVASVLMEYGIDWADINRRLFMSKSALQIKAEGLIASKLVLDGDISYATITLREKKENSISDEHLETAIEIIRSVLGAESAFFVREVEEGKYKVSMRSASKNVARVASKFGGGGHVLASGCNISADSIENVVEKILTEMKKGE